MSGPKHFSRRDFMKLTTGAVGGVVTVALGAPIVGYLIDPAVSAKSKEAWISVGTLADIPVGIPTPFTFTITSVNGWERTGVNYGGYIIRGSEDPADIKVLSSRCTHLGCTVAWNEDQALFVCPCHDAAFDLKGQVVHGPPPRPLDTYDDHRVGESGDLQIHFMGA